MIPFYYYLSQVTFHVTPDMNNSSVAREILALCDASEKGIWCSLVSKIREKLRKGAAFSLAQFRFAPKKQLSVIRPKLCITLCGAQQAELLRKALTLIIVKPPCGLIPL